MNGYCSQLLRCRRTDARKICPAIAQRYRLAPYLRLFAALDPKQLAACAGRWMAAVKAGIEANRCLVRFLPWIRG
jgi:hypothetical protein